MREIKFRAWDKKKKLMIYKPSLIAWDKNGQAFMDITEEGDEIEGLWIDIVMQYTGLRDKNGKEIYECDIVDVQLDWDCNGEVVFREGEYRVKLDSKHERRYDSLSLLLANSIEIIGNIYENKELIENK